MFSSLIGPIVTRLFSAWHLVMWGCCFYSVLWMLSLSSDAAAAVLHKNHLFMLAFCHLLMSRDKAWSKRNIPDPDVIKNIEPQATRRIVFVRHGESQWNEVFNRGFGPKFFWRLFKALFREFVLVFNPHDSVFCDSALGEEGFEQAISLLNFLNDPPKSLMEDIDRGMIDVLRGEKESSLIVSSNLRRALATAAVGFDSRLKRTKERIMVLSCLQEIGRNIDTLALAPPYSPARITMPTRMGSNLDPQAMDVSQNAGNKSMWGNAMSRMLQFAGWVFTREEGTIIVAGHSLWFRCFFQTFLPKESNHPAKTRKMANAGVVMFTLTRAMYNGKVVYRIPPESITKIYRGFL